MSALNPTCAFAHIFTDTCKSKCTHTMQLAWGRLYIHIYILTVASDTFLLDCLFIFLFALWDFSFFIFYMNEDISSIWHFFLFAKQEVILQNCYFSELDLFITWWDTSTPLDVPEPVVEGSMLNNLSYIPEFCLSFVTRCKPAYYPICVRVCI